jgi:hypothetical protein
VVPEGSSHDVGLGGIINTDDAHQDNAGMSLALAINQFAEVLVGRQKDGPKVGRFGKDRIVWSGGAGFGHGCDRVPILPQSLDDGQIHAFVGK